MAKTYPVIYGTDLAQFLRTRDPDLAAKIDPTGISVVWFSMLHNDGAEIQAHMLVKVSNDPKPLERRFTFPIEVWNKISHQVLDDGREASNAPSH